MNNVPPWIGEVLIRTESDVVVRAVAGGPPARYEVSVNEDIFDYCFFKSLPETIKAVEERAVAAVLKEIKER